MDLDELLSRLIEIVEESGETEQNAIDNKCTIITGEYESQFVCKIANRSRFSAFVNYLTTVQLSV